jgi:hypothetical protein
MFSCLLRLTMKSTHIRAFVIYLPLFSCLLRLTLESNHFRTPPPPHCSVVYMRMNLDITSITRIEFCIVIAIQPLPPPPAVHL